MINFTSVTKTYGKVRALNDVTLKVEPGSIIGLLGPNGSGKTTMLKLMLHIIRAKEGTITIEGEPISYETRSYISYMPDREFLYDTMSVQDAIHYYSDMFKDFDYNKAIDLCNKLSLNTADFISKLSKGNKEKVVLMLTLARQTKIYLLDEPLGSLDPVIKHEMLSVIKASKRPDATIIIATHLIKDTEEILDDVIFLKQGKVEVQESVSKIVKEHKSLENYYLEVFTNV